MTTTTQPPIASGTSALFGTLQSFAMQNMSQQLNYAAADIGPSSQATLNLMNFVYTGGAPNFNLPASYPTFNSTGATQLNVTVNGAALPSADYTVSSNGTFTINVPLKSTDTIETTVGSNLATQQTYPNAGSSTFTLPSTYPPIALTGASQLTVTLNGALLQSGDYTINSNGTLTVNVPLQNGDTIQTDIGFNLIQIGANFVRTPLDGITPGTAATGVGTDGKTYSGVVDTGLTRSLIFDTKGEVVHAADGRALYGTTNPSPGFYVAGSNPPQITSPADLSIGTFGSWNTTTQVEYIRAALGQNPGASQIGSTGALQIIIGPGGAQEHVMLAPDARHVYVLDSLNQASIAKMSFKDQTALSQSNFFTTLGPSLGLEPLSASQAISDILNGNGDDLIGLSGITGFTSNGRGIGDDDLLAFQTEVADLYARTSRTPIVNRQAVDTALAAITKRYKQALAYSPAAVAQGGGVFSDDGGATVRQGFAAFIAQEKAIAQADTQSLNASGLQITLNAPGAAPTVQDISSTARNLDLPAMIYLFQVLAFTKLNAINTAAIQSVNQTNALLRAYSEMQTLVNQASGALNPQKTDDVVDLTGIGGSHELSTSLTPQQQAVVTMFQSFLTVTDNPVEKLKGIVRPTQDLMYISDTTVNKVLVHYGHLKGQNSTFWSSFANSLNDAVTQINQNSQITMNSINSDDQMMNQFMNLASTAASQLYNLIQSMSPNLN